MVPLSGRGWWLHRWPPYFCHWPAGLLIKWGFCACAPQESADQESLLHWSWTECAAGISLKPPPPSPPPPQATPPFWSPSSLYLPLCPRWRSLFPAPGPCPFLTSWCGVSQTRTPGGEVSKCRFFYSFIFIFFFWVGYFVLWHRLTHITLPPPSSSCRSDTHTHVNLPTSYSYIILVTELLLAKTSFNFFQPGGKSYFLRK